MSKILSPVLCLSLVLPFAHAQEEVFSMKRQGMTIQEYYAGGYPGAVMMKVNLLGAVNKPGVYNVPVNTELNSVLSYAGGPSKDAELDQIMIRSKKGNGYEVKKMNLDEFFTDEEQMPYKLRPDDYVYVKQEKELVSNNTFRTTFVIATILGAIVSALVIDDQLKN